MLVSTDSANRIQVRVCEFQNGELELNVVGFPRKQTLRLAAASALAFCLPATATTYEALFSGSGFADLLGAFGPAPQQSVSGSIRFTAPALNGPIDTILSIDLDIARHAFDISEVDGAWNSGFYQFGGRFLGIYGMSNVDGVADFIIAGPGQANSSPPSSFAYSIDGGGGSWFACASSLQITAVPEAGTSAMLLAGMAGLLIRRRRPA